MKNQSEKKAIEIVMDYERKSGRHPKNVSKTGCGYDIESDNRFIEVKGIGENWRTYTWQSLYPSEVDCLNKNPENFYLYIVKFDDKSHDLYIIPGPDLKTKFSIKITAYALTPISRKKLSEFKI